MDSDFSLVLKPMVCHNTRELWTLNAVIKEAKEDRKPKCVGNSDFVIKRTENRSLRNFSFVIKEDNKPKCC